MKILATKTYAVEIRYATGMEVMDVEESSGAAALAKAIRIVERRQRRHGCYRDVRAAEIRRQEVME